MNKRRIFVTFMWELGTDVITDATWVLATLVPSVTSTVMLYMDLCSASKGFATTIVPTPLSASKELSKFPPSCRCNRKYNYNSQNAFDSRQLNTQGNRHRPGCADLHRGTAQNMRYHLCSTLISPFQGSLLYFRTDIATRDRMGRRK